MSKNKQMPLAQFTQLKKIMGMTTSIHDGEALSATRKANAILSSHSMTWADVFDRSVSVESVYTSYPPQARRGEAQGWPSSTAQGREDDDIYKHETNGMEEGDLREMIQSAFDELRGVNLGNFRDFIDSLERQFDQKRYLTPEQRRPLFEAVKRHRQGRRR